jgi:hypothetical protein
MLTAAAAIASILGVVATFLLKLWQGRGPAPLQTQSERVGALTAQLSQEQENDHVNQAIETAVARTSTLVSQPDSLRQFERTDPQNRDNRPARR